MTDKIILITPPDDVLLDGLRLLTVNLDNEQSNILSKSLLNLEIESNVIVYVYNTSDPIEWLLDKQIKSDVILFNANSVPEMIIGYMAAQSKSYYFGTLKDLHLVNNRVIYNTEDLGSLLDRKMKRNHER